MRKDYYPIYQIATSIEIAIFKRLGVKCALTLLNEKHLSPSTHIATWNDIHLFYFHRLLDATPYGLCVLAADTKIAYNGLMIPNIFLVCLFFYTIDT